MLFRCLLRPTGHVAGCWRGRLSSCNRCARSDFGLGRALACPAVLFVPEGSFLPPEWPHFTTKSAGKRVDDHAVEWVIGGSTHRYAFTPLTHWSTVNVLQLLSL